MDWSPQQVEALDRVQNWIANPHRQHFYLGGYAGTGKTTLAKYLAESVGSGVMFAAYTGKASHVLRTKGCIGASTIHSMIYKPKNKSGLALKELEAALQETIHQIKSEGPPDITMEDIHKDAAVVKLKKSIQIEKDNLSKPAFALNPESIALDARLIVIDEVSMVDEQMGQDLESFEKPILVLGDPAQLPPVKGGGYFTADDPDFMLTEIHRQAADNPIIDIATNIRTKRSVQYGDYGATRVIRSNDLTAKMALEADQILVGMNATRRGINKRVRELRGFSGDYPNASEKLVCLRNNHDLGILNGSLWIVQQCDDPDPDSTDTPLLMTIVSDDDSTQVVRDVEVWKHHFTNDADELDYWTRLDAEEFDFGYALTVHKSQGSQWKKTLVLDESGVFRDNWRKWLYTGVTRASDSMTLVLNY